MANTRIAVIGAGLMGHGIAQVFALAGHDVTIYDPATSSLDTAKTRILTNLKDLGENESAVERVTPVADLARAVRDADYVVEAVLEDLPLKQKLFAEIETHVRPAHHSRQQYVRHSNHQHHGRSQTSRSRSRYALVEPTLSRALGRGD